MRLFPLPFTVVAIVFAGLAGLALFGTACSPAPRSDAGPAPGPTSDGGNASQAPPNGENGVWGNSWDSAEFSRFRHTLTAPTPGSHTITLQASTSSPGGETVAIYPVKNGEKTSARTVYVIATKSGNSETATLDFPEDGSGIEVEVVIENASNRRFSGSYTVTVEP